MLDVTTTTTSTRRAWRSGWPSNPPAGVDTRRNTVFLINWYGRSDFKFHVYTKTNEPDPDTGYNFGVERDSRKIIAWGGTTAERRGGRARQHPPGLVPRPVGRAGVVDRQLERRRPRPRRRRRAGLPDPADLGVRRRRLPRAGGADRRPRQDHPVRRAEPAVHHLAALPGRAADRRAAAIDQPRQQHLRGLAGRRRIAAGTSSRDLVTAELQELRWRNRLNYDNQDLPYAGEAKRCYEAGWRTSPATPSSATRRSPTSTCRTRVELARTQDDQGKVDYELPIFNYAVGTESTPRPSASPTTTTSTAPRATSSPSSRPRSSRPATASPRRIIHEVGHHVGLSHPHDGYDSAAAVGLRAAGRLLLRLARRRVELDDELHRPQLGLQPVRPGQHEPVPDRRATTRPPTGSPPRSSPRPRHRGRTTSCARPTS